MKKILIFLLLVTSLVTFSQDKKTPEVNKKEATEAINNIQKYYDISEEGTLYPKGTFPRKQDTTKVVAIYSVLNKVSTENGDEITNPKLIQKVIYIITKPNSFVSYIYLDENKKPLPSECIIWQTKEFTKK